MSGGGLILPLRTNQGDVLTLDANKDLQWLLPGDPGTIGTFFVFNEIPVGAVNGINLSFRTANKFLTGKLQVYLSGAQLTGLGSEKNFVEHVDLQGFTIIIGTSPQSVKEPPRQNELLTVAYIRDI